MKSSEDKSKLVNNDPGSEERDGVELDAAGAQDQEELAVKEDAQEKPAKPNIATFRGIPKKLHESLKATASDLGVSPGELARYFLEVGLARVEGGEDVIEPKFVPGGYTLYPDEGPKKPKKKARQKSKMLQQPRSYYGVPRDVVQAVLAQSRAIGVTQGELARYLFERGLARYKKGELVISPEPVQQIATLYPEDLGKV